MDRKFSIRRMAPALMMTALLTAAACGGKSGSHGDFPKNFASMSDAAKMTYMMKKVSPDSVARFICDASLGRIEGIRIDTLSMAALYAYEHYHDDELQSFQAAFDAYADSLPLPEKMKLRRLAASDNPDALGYQLGLEYANDIRTGSKTARDVEAEIAAMKKVCAEDPADSLTFKRFMTGFKIALDNDGADGIPRSIYEKYK